MGAAPCGGVAMRPRLDYWGRHINPLQLGVIGFFTLCGIVIAAAPYLVIGAALYACYCIYKDYTE
jgi:hypothetical protein